MEVIDVVNQVAHDELCAVQLVQQLPCRPSPPFHVLTEVLLSNSHWRDRLKHGDGARHLGCKGLGRFIAVLLVLRHVGVGVPRLPPLLCARECVFAWTRTWAGIAACRGAGAGTGVCIIQPIPRQTPAPQRCFSAPSARARRGQSQSS